MSRWWPFPRRERVRVDLDPSQLVTVHFLLRYKAAPENKIYDEVAATTWIDRGDFLRLLVDLVSRGIVEPHPQPETQETWFVLTDLGKRLRGKIPRESKAAIAVYV